MKQYIGCDARARYSVFVSVDETGRVGTPVRVAHEGRDLRNYLEGLEKGTPVAVEASGGWYWFMDKLDAKGLAILLRSGTLPEVWIPPADLRDLRGLMRTRLATRSQTTVLKNRIHAALRRYGVMGGESRGDLFTKKHRLVLSVAIGRLPEETRRATLHEWEMLDLIERHIGELEVRIRERIGRLGWVRLLKSMPGVGEILGRHDRSGDRRRKAIPGTGAVGQLRGTGAACSFQRWQDVARKNFAVGEPLPALGFRGSRQCHSAEPAQVCRSACDRALRPAKETQMPWQGCSRGSQALGRGQLVASDKKGTVSAAACASGGDVFVQKRVNAGAVLAFEA